MEYRRSIAIDTRAVVNLVGTLGKYLGLAALFPAAVAIGYREAFWPFLMATALTSGGGWALERVTAGSATRVGFREGFIVVSATWLLAAAFASIPYLVAGGDQLGHPIDAYFEGMSGFTTTGASVVTDFDELSKSMAMWRQFTQWLGGMGIIVLAIAVLPRLRVGGRQLLLSEMPGPDMGDLTQRLRDTARQLWVLYIALTAVLTAVLAAFGWTGIDQRMTLYEAAAHAFGVMPTGGFSTQPDSAASFSGASQWVMGVFMLLAGANYVLMYRALIRRRPGSLARDDEFRLYLALVTVASTGLSLQIWGEGIFSGEEALRAGFFQAVSIVTTTGMASTDFALWPTLSLLTIFALMFMGGSAGSTAGSIKVVRHLLVARILRREVSQTVTPELVMPIRVNGAPVEERTLRAIAAFVILYLGAWALGSAVIAIDSAAVGTGLAPLDSLAASATALGNVGPGFGVTGPFGSYAPLGDVSKVTMIALMFLGRLEIVPIAVLFTRHYWRV